MNKPILATVIATACSTLAFAAPPEKSAGNSSQGYPKNIARQHYSTALSLYDSAAQRYVDTEAAAAWMDDDVTTGWPALKGKQHYLVRFAEPQLVSNFELSTTTPSGTISLYTGDAEAAPGDKSWALVAKDVPVASVNNQKLARRINKFAKYVLIETNIDDSSPIYSVNIYGERQASSMSIVKRQEPANIKQLLGEFVNPPTAFNIAGIYAKGAVTFANTGGSENSWQRAIDDDSETSLSIKPSTAESGLVLRFDGTQPVTRLSLLTSAKTRGKVDIFLLSEAPDKSTPVSIEGVQPSVTLSFDGTSQRTFADFAETKATALAIRWTPESGETPLAIRELNVFADISLTEFMFRPHAAVPNGQYLELTNRTGAPLDLTGWQLSNPIAPTFFVPAGFVLPANVPTVIGTTTDPAQNDDAGVVLGWAASGFTLSPDAGTFVIGTADAGSGFTYTGPVGGARGQSLDVDHGPFVGTTGTPGVMACLATSTYGSQTPLQLGSPGSDPGCGFGYTLRSITPHFVDISDGGTALINSPATAVSSLTVAITLAATGTDPAPFAFGARRDIVSMSVDGWLVWGTNAITAASNTLVTSTTSTTKGKLAVFWDDQQTTPVVLPLSEMYWKHFAAGEDPLTPAQHWVFQWAHVRHVSTTPSDDLNYEIKLFEDGSVEYHYGAMVSGTTSNYADGNSATVWLENPAGDRALVIGLNQPVILPNTAYRFVPR